MRSHLFCSQDDPSNKRACRHTSMTEQARNLRSKRDACVRARPIPARSASLQCSRGQYQVSRLIDSRGYDQNREFLVEWEGYGLEENSWEPLANILDPTLIENYEKSEMSARR